MPDPYASIAEADPQIQERLEDHKTGPVAAFRFADLLSQKSGAYEGTSGGSVEL